MNLIFVRTSLFASTLALAQCMGASTTAADNYSVIVEHEKHGEMTDTGYTLPACHLRVATIISRVAIPTGKPYGYNGTDEGWGYDDSGRFSIRCAAE